MLSSAFEYEWRNLYNSKARKASTESEKPAIYWVYGTFVVEPSQFVKVAENYTPTVAPKEKILSFLMANNG